MKSADIARIRLANQLLSRHPHTAPEQVVAHFGAMQAQDYPGALWAVAQRTPRATLTAVEHAIAERRIVRSWPMRNTLHIMAGRDARWMLELLTPRANESGGWATRRAFLGITDRDMSRARTIVRRALAGGTVRTRPELYGILDRSGVATSAQRGLHILSKLAHELLICFGPHKGKQATFVLLDDWLPHSEAPERDEALGRIATTYFRSHGPATIKDFTWWSGMTVADAKRGIAVAGAALRTVDVAGTVHHVSSRIPDVKPTKDAHLLPPFDEMLVAYQNRTASLDALYHHHVSGSKNGFMQPTVVVDGQVVATWRRSASPKRTDVTVTPFFTLSSSVKRAIAAAGDRYARYLGMPVRLL